MTRRRDASARRRATALVRWYPRAWRDRYGDELVDLITETDPISERLRVRARASIIRAGLTERVRQGVAGQGTASDRARSGAGLILWGWAMVTAAGMALAKVSEHWPKATPVRDQWLPSAALVVSAVGALVMAALVAAAAVITVPAVARFVAAGRARELRVRLTAAGCAIAATVVTTVVLATTSRSSTVAGGVAALGALWALCVVGSLFAVTSVASGLVSTVDLSVRVQSAHLAMARVGGAVTTVVIAALATWWASVAVDAPQFLGGPGSGLFNAPWSLMIAPVSILLVGGLVVVVTGQRRIARSRAPSS